MSQTSYDEQGAALNGQKYDLSNDVVSSYAAEERIPFGCFVSLGTDKDEQVKLPALAADITDVKAKRGVCVHDHSNENVQDGLAPGVEAKKPVNVMQKGRVWVEVEQAVSPSDPVYVRFANDGGGAGATDQKGIFRKDADDSVAAAAALLSDARWYKSSQTVDGKLLAVLELL